MKFPDCSVFQTLRSLLIVPLHAGVASRQVLWAVFVTTIQEGHKAIRECPKESNKGGERSGHQDMMVG